MIPCCGSSSSSLRQPRESIRRPRTVVSATAETWWREEASIASWPRNWPGADVVEHAVGVGLAGRRLEPHDALVDDEERVGELVAQEQVRASSYVTSSMYGCMAESISTWKASRTLVCGIGIDDIGRPPAG